MALVGGARPEVLDAIIQRFALTDVRSYSPPFRAPTLDSVRADLAAARIIADSPQWIWVGLGAPKQELWMKIATQIHPDAIYFGVGAAFDFLSGEKLRAPRWMRHLGLEWMHRLLSEPQRLSGRYFRSNVKFLVRTLLARN